MPNLTLVLVWVNKNRASENRMKPEAIIPISSNLMFSSNSYLLRLNDPEK